MIATRIFWPLLLAALLVPLSTLGAEGDPAAPQLRFYENKGGDFTLTGHDGQAVALHDFRGRVVLLSFGYTSCPDVCPATLAILRATLGELGPQAAQVQPLFVSVDPERDTLSKLAGYMGYFGESFIGLRGDAVQTAQVARQYRVRYAKRESESLSGYSVDHSAFIFLVDQGGRLRYTFPHTTPPAYIAAGVRELLRTP